MCNKCGHCILKTLFIIFAFIFAIVSLTLIGLGGFVLFGKSIVLSQIGDNLETFENSIQSSIFEEIGLDLKQLLSDSFDFIAPLGAFCFVIGVLLFVGLFIGFCGVCYEVKVCLIIFLVLVGGVSFIFMVLSLHYAAGKSDIKSKAKAYYQDQIDSKYTGYKNKNVETLIINMVQIMLKCCGIDNSGDFLTSSSWNRTFPYKNGLIEFPTQLAIPFTCCDFDGFVIKELNCTLQTLPTSVTSNFDVGCYDKLHDALDPYVNYAALAFGLFVLLWGLMLAYGTCLLVSSCMEDSQVYPKS